MIGRIVTFSSVIGNAFVFAFQVTVLLALCRACYATVKTFWGYGHTVVTIWACLLFIQTLVNGTCFLFGTEDKETEQQESNDGGTDRSFLKTPNFVTNLFSTFWMLVCVLWSTLLTSVSQLIYFISAVVLVEAFKIIRKHFMLALGIFVAMFCLYLMGHISYSIFTVD